jgi:uridine kinase
LADRIVDRIRARRGPEAAVTLSFDAYYHDQLHLPMAERRAVNYDHPDSLDGDLLIHHLRDLRAGRDVAVPVYDFAGYRRTGDLRALPASDVVVVEGILLFSFPGVWEQLDYSVFRRCPESVRFGRRMRRDMVERGRTRESVLSQLAASVKPMHDQFVEPFASRADAVTDHGDDLADATLRLADQILSRCPDTASVLGPGAPVPA